ncbi:MAG TPA: hypothetical protein VFS58_01005 [Steroidobacteraceae bacterium]|nr:hypothetical protein [Steroidobacteraceae bacterium]
MNDDLETRDPHPHTAQLLKQYARDLAQIAPSSDLDARIGTLVADRCQKIQNKPLAAGRPPLRLWRYAAAAGIAALAIGVGIFIGMKIEHTRELSVANPAASRDAAWPPADLAMWPTDSVSFKVPAEYSAQGILVAVDPDSKNTSTRYWIDVVVSNDGTFRIERIVPADTAPRNGGHDDVAPQVQ